MVRGLRKVSPCFAKHQAGFQERCACSASRTLADYHGLALHTEGERGSTYGFPPIINGLHLPLSNLTTWPWTFTDDPVQCSMSPTKALVVCGNSFLRACL